MVVRLMIARHLIVYLLRVRLMTGRLTTVSPSVSRQLGARLSIESPPATSIPRVSTASLQARRPWSQPGLCVKFCLEMLIKSDGV